jgi:hypothetical protein
MERAFSAISLIEIAEAVEPVAAADNAAGFARARLREKS